MHTKVELRNILLAAVVAFGALGVGSHGMPTPPDDEDPVIIHVDTTAFGPPFYWEITGAFCLQMNKCPPGPKYHGEENGLPILYGCKRMVSVLDCKGNCAWCEGADTPTRVCVQATKADTCYSDYSNPVECGRIGYNTCKYSARKWVGHMRTSNNCYCPKPLPNVYGGSCSVAQCS